LRKQSQQSTLIRWRIVNVLQGLAPPAMKEQIAELGSPALIQMVGALNVHTPTMTIKNAALLALIGTILATVLLIYRKNKNLLLGGIVRPFGYG
jgi:hypothetical protein